MKASLNVVRKSNEFPIDEETLRPYRIWNAAEKHAENHRWYAYPWSAIEGAWRDIQWAKVGVSLEVFNTENGRHIATFTRTREGFTRWVHREHNYRYDPKQERPRG